jgi:hypothetical protein
VEACAICGTVHLHPDIKRLAQLKFKMTLCQQCFYRSKHSTTPPTPGGDMVCKVCGADMKRPVDGQPRCQNCRVAESVGADYFACDCGDTVPIAQSVRLMRKNSGKIERVCVRCSQDGACAADKHAIVTTKHKDWDEAKWTFQPVPDSLQRGVCSRCDVALYWDGKDWRRMTWLVLADMWEKADA